MSLREEFIQEIQKTYQYKGDKIVLGKAKLNGEVLSEAEISVALKTLNRHGLIAGATGTGKTKSLQILAEQLSLKGVPCLLMDIKGDLSGIAMPGEADDKGIQERQSLLGLEYTPAGAPVELLSLSDEKGVRLRATVSEFGPILFSKILDLNETQTSIISIIYKYCDDKGLPLLDLSDMRKVLQYVSENNEGKKELTSNYGSIAPASLGAILRKIVALEQQGASRFFGEPSFEVNDLMRTRDGKGVVSIIRLTDIQNKPNLFSTFMLSLLAEIYETLPEIGDPDKPKLVMFIDEAHLIFREASKALLDQIETMVKLIRSKGVGLYFCTQVPGDVPDGVLSQLGLKIQHALRGFTAKDRKQIQKAVENYPISAYYKADEVITQLGIGEAFITALNEKGVPTPLAHTYMRAPISRMDVLTETEIQSLVSDSVLVPKYSMDIDRDSAYEILNRKLEMAAAAEPTPTPKKQVGRPRKEKSTLETILTDSTTKSFIRTIGNQIIRGFFGKIKKR
ncbi:MAG: DUF853 family protein [Flavobacteriaceae bacterium]|jgi:DNA helicase HerA-like ATPase|nr:DUF853 family protein [Flavobacteriaceae bacterium]